MGLSCHRIAAFPYAVIYNSQIVFNGYPLARRRGRVGGIVAVGVSVGVDVGALRELVNFD